MWKLVVGFVVFAVVVVFVLKKAGGSVDMGDEKHAIEAEPAPAEAASGAALVASR